MNSTIISKTSSHEANRAKHSWKAQVAIEGSLSLPGFLFSCLRVSVRNSEGDIANIVQSPWVKLNTAWREVTVKLPGKKIPLQAERDNFNLAVQYQTCVSLLSKLQVKVWLPLGLSKFECEQKLRELTFELQITAIPSGLRIIINVIDF